MISVPVLLRATVRVVLQLLLLAHCWSFNGFSSQSAEWGPGPPAGAQFAHLTVSAGLLLSVPHLSGRGRHSCVAHK